MTNSNIMFSVQPQYLKLILNGDKQIEYRNTFWNVSYPSWFYVYESKPVSKLKYCFLLGKPYKRGEIIPFSSYGTEAFNKGNGNRKYAYPILNVKVFEEPIRLEELKQINVTPPQNYMYVNRNVQLSTILLDKNFSYFRQVSLF